MIGVLFAAIEIASGFGSLAAGRAMRWGDPQKTMLSGTVASILFICATPFLGGVFLLLLLAQIGRGWLQGVVQPMMFSVQAKAVGRYRQGSVVGLRQTANRLSSIVIPPIMGVDCRLVGHDREFCRARRRAAADLRADRADHAPRRAGPGGCKRRPSRGDRGIDAPKRHAIKLSKIVLSVVNCRIHFFDNRGP